VVGDADRGDDRPAPARALYQGKTIKETAGVVEHGREGAESGETSFEYERLDQARPMLGVWAAKLDGLLAANATKSACEQLTLIRIFENCAAGYDGYGAALRQTVE